MSTVVRSPDAYTAVVRRGAAENAKRVASREEAMQRLAQERLEREQALISAKAAEKQRREEEARRLLAASETPETAEQGGDYDIGDLDWPLYYGVASKMAIPSQKQEKVTHPTREETIRAEAAVLEAVCTTQITMKELVEYIEFRKPDSFGWGSAPQADTTLVSYRASKVYTQTGTLTYAVSSLDRQGQRAEGKWPITDTAANLLRTLRHNEATGYVPGMVIDIKTLIAVLARRTACISGAARFAETRSYSFFEDWIAIALETEQDIVLAHTLDTLTGTNEAATILVEYSEKKQSAREALITLAGSVRNRYWH